MLTAAIAAEFKTIVIKKGYKRDNPATDLLQCQAFSAFYHDPPTFQPVPLITESSTCFDVFGYGAPYYYDVSPAVIS